MTYKKEKKHKDHPPKTKVSLRRSIRVSRLGATGNLASISVH